MITYVKGDVTLPKASRYELPFVCHIVNDENKFGSGVAAAIAKRFPHAKKMYHEWVGQGLTPYNTRAGLQIQVPFRLGYNQVCFTYSKDTDKDLIVVNMLAQHGLKSAENPHPLDYNALQQCLEGLNVIVSDYENTGIHLPKIGCCRGGGNWAKVLEMIETTLGKHKVTIYEFDE